MAKQKQLQRAVIAIAAGGTGAQQLIGAQGAGKKIRVVAMHLSIETAQTTPGAKFQSAANDISGAEIYSGGEKILLPTLPEEEPRAGMSSGWLETNANEALNLNITVASRISGWVLYRVVS
jgi:hypothetical protein